MKLSDEAAEALLRLLQDLERAGYDFIAPTPATHARVVARPDMRHAADLRGIFGWSLPFAPETLPQPMRDWLDQGDLLDTDGALLRSRVRVSRLGERLFVHSAYPTEDKDAVFFGPDSYRFVDFIRSEATRMAGARRLVDIGAGSGVGGIMASALLPGARVTLLDVNPGAVGFAAVNARHAGIDAELVEGEGLSFDHLGRQDQKRRGEPCRNQDAGQDRKLVPPHPAGNTGDGPLYAGPMPVHGSQCRRGASLPSAIDDPAGVT